MKLSEYLLMCLTEECGEVSQRASKAGRFGINEVQPGQNLTNDTRLEIELSDLAGIVELLIETGVIAIDPFTDRARIDAKKAKVAEYMEYSARVGCLQD